LLINQAWQPLPGTREAQIYPYFRKPDLLSSNSCLISTPDQIILIDPGALVEQTDHLGRVLMECQRERLRPVVIYLTHCHIDHSLESSRYRQMSVAAPVWIAVQEKGADYLLEGDRGKTIAELYGVTFPCIQADIRLLTVQDLKRRTPRYINLAPGIHLKLETETVPAHPDQSISRQNLSTGGDVLEVYPAPGHGPDSLCIRIGDILFIGDLLAAANPMVAGISGWSREDYLRTLEQVLWLLDALPIRWCYPGHGSMIPADKARDVLKRLHQKTSRTGDVIRMNEDRLFEITDFALELIDEAEEVFSSIAGRLLYVAHQLETLQEEDAAENCRQAMPMEAVDACLLDFRALCLALDAQKIRRVEFAFGALQIIEKMRLLFDPRALGAILPRSLIHRGTSLLLDFIGLAHGCRNPEEFIPADINDLIRETAGVWQSSPHLDASVIEVVGDEEAYLAALVRRIGHEPPANRPVPEFALHDNLPLVRIPAARFLDTLLNFLEWFNESDQPVIAIATGLDRTGPFITVTAENRAGLTSTPYREKKIRSFSRRFRLCGFNLKADPTGYRLTLVEEDNEK